MPQKQVVRHLERVVVDITNAAATKQQLLSSERNSHLCSELDLHDDPALKFPEPQIS